MENIKIKLILMSLFFTGLNWLQAQETISAIGEDASGTGGSASYTVGQVVYTTNTGTTGSVSQGVQQSYEISVVNVTELYKDFQIDVFTYPNPVKDDLILKIDAENLNDLSYQIYDINGKMLVDCRLTNRETSIYMGDFLPAAYFLRVIKSDKEIKIFKIVKN
jgi:hypothetical protein